MPKGDIAATILRPKFSNPWGCAAIDQTMKHSMPLIEVATLAKRKGDQVRYFLGAGSSSGS